MAGEAGGWKRWSWLRPKPRRRPLTASPSEGGPFLAQANHPASLAAFVAARLLPAPPRRSRRTAHRFFWRLQAEADERLSGIMALIMAVEGSCVGYVRLIELLGYQNSERLS